MPLPAREATRPPGGVEPCVYLRACVSVLSFLFCEIAAVLRGNGPAGPLRNDFGRDATKSAKIGRFSHLLRKIAARFARHATAPPRQTTPPRYESSVVAPFDTTDLCVCACVCASGVYPGVMPVVGFHEEGLLDSSALLTRASEKCENGKKSPASVGFPDPPPPPTTHRVCATASGALLTGIESDLPYNTLDGASGVRAPQVSEPRARALPIVGRPGA
jgi:hypothetical protein